MVKTLPLLHLLPFVAPAILLVGCATQTTLPKSLPSPSPIAQTAPTLRQNDVFGAVVNKGTVSASVAGTVAPGLDFVAMIKQRPGQRALTDNDLPALQLDRQGLLALAAANMEAGLRPIAEVTSGLPAGQIGTICGDRQEASRLALHEDWVSLAIAMNANLIVAVPAADTMLYGDGNDPAAALTIQARARTAMSGSPAAISDAVFRWTQSGWERVLPPSK